jgi:hypothetical protein
MSSLFTFRELINGWKVLVDITRLEGPLSHRGPRGLQRRK